MITVCSPIILLELSPLAYHIIIEIKIGRKNVRMLIDTGASQTLFGENFSKANNFEFDEMDDENVALGIGIGDLSPKLGKTPKLKIGDITIKNLYCIILPIEHVNSTYNSLGIKPIDGIIGMDLLKTLNAKLDLEEMTLTFNVKKKNIDFSKIYPI